MSEEKKELAGNGKASKKAKKDSVIPHGVSKAIVRNLVVGILIVTLALNGTGLYMFYRYAVNQLYENAESIALECSAYVDGDRVLSYLEGNGSDSVYDRTRDFFQTVLEQENCVTIYAAVLDPAEKTRTYVIDVVSEESGYTPYAIGYMDSYSHHTAKNQAYLEAAASGEAEADSDVSVMLTQSESLGHYIEVVKPVYNSNGEAVAFVCVVKQENELYRSLRIFSLRTIITGLLIAAVAAVLMSILMRRRLVRPLNEIVNETERFRKEKTASERAVTPYMGREDEFTYLSDSLQGMEMDIEQQIEQIEENSNRQSRLDAQLQLANQIQNAAIPEVTPVFQRNIYFSLGAMMQPAKMVGGDFYDFYMLDDDRLVMTIADVSDKGIAAAMYMMMSKFLLKERVMNGGRPSDILRDVNEAICRNEANENFVTVWLGILDLRTGEILACNAGHEYPLLKRKDAGFAVYKEPHGLPVGVISGAKYQDYTLQLAPGDWLFLYTDGLAEANNTAGDQYGLERLVADLNGLAADISQDLVEAAWKQMNAFAVGAEQFDDTTMLCLKLEDVKKQEVDQFTTEAVQERMPEAGAFLEERMEAAGLEVGMIQKLDIVIDELLSNIVNHSQAKQMTVGIACTQEKVTLLFADDGTPYDPTQISDSGLEGALDGDSIGGWGLKMVKRMTDEMKYSYQSGKNTLLVVKKRT